MNLKQIAKDTTATLISYLTYQAMRTVLSQLSEMDPPQALWLRQFSTSEKLQNGETYLQELMRERPDLAYRLMTVREHIATEIADVLPEMLKTGIQSANLSQRRAHLERVTGMNDAPSSIPEDPSAPQDPIGPES